MKELMKKTDYMHDFSDQLIWLIEQKLPAGVREGVQVKVTRMQKMNQPDLHGLMLETEGCPKTPIYYIEDLYDAWEDGTTLEELAESLVSHYMGLERPDEIDAKLEHLLCDYSIVKDCTALRLLSESRNRGYLEQRPSRRVFADLVLTCDIRIRNEDFTDEWRIPVDWPSLRSFGIDTMQLFGEALQHAEEYDPPVLYRLSELAAGLRPQNLYYDMRSVPAEEKKSTIYVLSSATERYGASVIAYPGMEAYLETWIGGSYYLLPSSVHEMLVVPEPCVDDPAHYVAMVRNANRNIVSEKEVLSDSIYFHDASTCRTTAVC